MKIPVFGRFREGLPRGSFLSALLFQSLLGGISVALSVVLLGMSLRVEVVSALGSSSFILFLAPSSQAARLRSFAGGYLVSMLCALFSCWIPVGGVAVAVAIFLSCVAMWVLGVSHPPACGVALSLVVYGCSAVRMLGVVLSVLVMASLHLLFRDRFVDLV